MLRRVNRIAFVNPNGELETISPDGTQRRRIAPSELFFQFPAWSPDGQRVAAVGGTFDRAGVFVFEDAANDTARLDPPPAIYESDRDAPVYVFWSPDSQHLSFITNRVEEKSLGLHVASVVGTSPAARGEATSRLVATGRPCFWDWSADGKRILLHTGLASEEDSQLKFIDPFNPASGNASLARPGLFQAPGIARSGRFWAFGQINRAGELQLVVDGRSTPKRMLVPHHGIAAMSWSPAHDQLAYISPTEPVRTYYGPLRLLDATTGKVRVLTDDIVLAFFWSPDGRHIAYFTIANIAEYVQHNILPNPDAAVHDGGFWNRDEAGQERDPEQEETEEERTLRFNLWSVDIEQGEHRLIVTFEPVDTFVNHLLPFFDQYALSHRIWSPDSDAIVLPMMAGGDEGNERADIYVVPMSRRGGPPRPIAEGTMAFWSQC
jgi:TolB protein